MWRQRVKKETIVLCDVSYNYKYGIKDDNLVAINIRAVDGGPLANSRRIENDNHSNVDENVNEETRRPPMIVDALKTDTIRKLLIFFQGKAFLHIFCLLKSPCT